MSIQRNATSIYIFNKSNNSTEILFFTQLLKFGKHQAWWIIIDGCHWRQRKDRLFSRDLLMDSGQAPSRLLFQLQLRLLSTNILLPASISHNLFGNNIRKFYLPSLSLDWTGCLFFVLPTICFTIDLK